MNTKSLKLPCLILIFLLADPIRALANSSKSDAPICQNEMRGFSIAIKNTRGEQSTNRKSSIPFDENRVREEAAIILARLYKELPAWSPERWFAIRRQSVNDALSLYAQIRAVMKLKGDTLKSMMRDESVELPDEGEAIAELATGSVLLGNFEEIDPTIKGTMAQRLVNAAQRFPNFYSELEKVNLVVRLMKLGEEYGFIDWIKDLTEGAFDSDAMIRTRIARLAWASRWIVLHRHGGPARWHIHGFKPSGEQGTSLEKLNREGLLQVKNVSVREIDPSGPVVLPSETHLSLDATGWAERIRATGHTITLSQLAFVSAKYTVGFEGFINTVVEVRAREASDWLPGLLPVQVRLISQEMR